MRMRLEGLGVAEPGGVGYGGSGMWWCNESAESSLLLLQPYWVVRAEVVIDKPPQQADGRAVAAVPVQRPLGLGGHRLLSRGCRYFDFLEVEVLE